MGRCAITWDNIVPSLEAIDTLVVEVNGFSFLRNLAWFLKWNELIKSTKLHCLFFDDKIFIQNDGHDGLALGY